MKQRFDPYSRTNQLIIDGVIFAVAFAAAFLIRFEGFLPWPSMKQLLLWIPYLIFVRLLVNWKLGIYRFIWRYVSLTDAIAVGRSLLLVTSLLLVLRLLYPGWAPFALWLRLPLSVIALEFLLSLTGCLGARALRRVLYERCQRVLLPSVERPKRVALYGAGRAGVLLLKELQNHAEVEVVGLVDDDPRKVGTIIMGTKVLGPGKALSRIVRESRVDEMVISIATASPRVLREILARCQEVSVAAKIIPSLQEIVEGRVSISQVREIRVEDLLGREGLEIASLGEDVRQVYRDKRVLVTGAGGSIGSELVRQLLPMRASAVALLDKDENSIYELEQEVAFRFPEACVEAQVADLRDRCRLRALLGEFKPQVVFHAAAHKHVPLMEKHPCEAVLNNVGGTMNLLEALGNCGTERLIFISTDKAVNPISVMGATKRLGEFLVRAFAHDGVLASACVRFGNVMDSRGSVIPLFRKQIAEGGPISLTHPDMVRYFMTIPEAVQLVLCAGAEGREGEIFVLDMGNPRRIRDLAEEMVRLSGLVPGEDIEIAVTGLRPGEKIVEELTGPNETVCPTHFEKLMKIKPEPLDGKPLIRDTVSLLRAAEENDRRGVHQILLAMGLDFALRTEGT